MSGADEFDARLDAHGAEHNFVIAVCKAGSGKRAEALQERALSHGWPDTQNNRIDDERYRSASSQRRAGSTWGPKNRPTAQKMLEEDGMKPGRPRPPPNDL